MSKFSFLGEGYIYRVLNERFCTIIDAEIYALDNRYNRSMHLPMIEMFYKDRWHVMGGKPEVLRVAL